MILDTPLPRYRAPFIFHTREKNYPQNSIYEYTCFHHFLGKEKERKTFNNQRLKNSVLLTEKSATLAVGKTIFPVCQLKRNKTIVNRGKCVWSVKKKRTGIHLCTLFYSARAFRHFDRDRFAKIAHTKGRTNAERGREKEGHEHLLAGAIKKFSGPGGGRTRRVSVLRTHVYIVRRILLSVWWQKKRPKTMKKW